MEEGKLNTGVMDASNQTAGGNILNVQENKGGIHFHTDKKPEIIPASRFLCKQLIEALQESSIMAREFLDEGMEFLEPAEKERWEHIDSYVKLGMEKIVESFPSIIGNFFFKLTGCENQKDYFELGLAMTKRTLQLLCFSFISKFWDLSKEKKYDLKPEQKVQFNRFFHENIDQNILFYANFFKTLLTLFHENGLDYPIAEAKSLEADFYGENIFLNTCKSIDVYRAQYAKDQILPPMDEFEETFTSFLISVKFLVNYKMVSVKSIGYEAVRNRDAQFVHAYSMLGVNSQGMNNGIKYLFQDKAINTDAVLLFKDKYLDALNLFPFIIDINALKEQDLSRIYFYVYHDKKNRKITYVDTYKVSSDDKQSPDEIITFNKEFEEVEKNIIDINKTEDRDITDLKKGTGEKYKTLKKYELYKTFQLSKSIFFGNEVP